MHLRESERWGEGEGGNKSRTGTDCRVKGGRDSEVERISESEGRAEAGGR